MEYSKKDRKTFKELILDYVEKIMDICTHEFTGGYWKKIEHGNHTEDVYVPDQRKVYIQSIEVLSDVLNPHFTKTAKEKYKSIMKEVNDLLKKYDDEKIKQEDYVIAKVRLMRKLFLALNFLLVELKISKIKTISEIG